MHAYFLIEIDSPRPECDHSPDNTDNRDYFNSHMLKW